MTKKKTTQKKTYEKTPTIREPGKYRVRLTAAKENGGWRIAEFTVLETKRGPELTGDHCIFMTGRYKDSGKLFQKYRVQNLLAKAFDMNADEMFESGETPDAEMLLEFKENDNGFTELASAMLLD